MVLDKYVFFLQTPNCGFKQKRIFVRPKFNNKAMRSKSSIRTQKYDTHIFVQFWQYHDAVWLKANWHCLIIANIASSSFWQCLKGTAFFFKTARLTKTVPNYNKWAFEILGFKMRRAYACCSCAWKTISHTLFAQTLQ